MLGDMQLVAHESANFAPLFKGIVATFRSIIGRLGNNEYTANRLHFARIKQLAKLILAI